MNEFKPKFSLWNVYSGVWTPTYLFYKYVLVMDNDDLTNNAKKAPVWVREKRDDSIFMSWVIHLVMVALFVVHFALFAVFLFNCLFVKQSTRRKWFEQVDVRWNIESDLSDRMVPTNDW